MTDQYLVAPGGGEVVRDSPERRVEILSEDDALHATWARFGPRQEGADLHVHRLHTDLFYVLEGELTVRLGLEDEPAVLPAGALARVPPLVIHGYRNASDGDLRYLNLHAPGMGFGEYLRALRDGRPHSFDQHEPPADGGRPTADAILGRGAFAADGSGWRRALLADDAEIRIEEVWGDPGEPSTPAHVHRGQLEAFYVLEGAMTFRIGERELRADAGSWVRVPPGLEHTFAPVGDRPARFVDVHAPGLL